MPEDISGSLSSAGGAQLSLWADCSRCFGLCCVAPAFAVSSDFAIDKPAGQPCPHLDDDSGCNIHASLRERGFPGCAVFDCLGAGQKVAQVTFGGQSWRGAPERARQMFDVFHIMRQLHELLWLLNEALSWPPAGALRDRMGDLLHRTEGLTYGSPESLAQLDITTHRREVEVLLTAASDLVREGVRRRGGPKPADHRAADLMGKDLRKKDLTGANLRGAYLIGADLRGVDLRWADLLGADLRGAEVGGADLSQSLFLTQAQVDAARGDGATTLATSMRRPHHWRR